MAGFDEAHPDISGGDVYNLERLHERATPEQQIALEALYASFLRMRRRAEIAEEQRDASEREASMDAKTGIQGVRALDAKCKELDGRIAALQYPESMDRRELSPSPHFAVAFIDIDEFKSKINGVFGYSLGDVFIRHVARYLDESMREGDEVYRWGGDEFVITLEGVSLGHEDDAKARIQGLFTQAVDGNLDEELVAQYCWAKGMTAEEVMSIVGSLRASVGIATYDSERHESVQAMLLEAETLMSRDKIANGRGR